MDARKKQNDLNHSLCYSQHGVHIEPSLPYFGFTLDRDLQPVLCGASLGPSGDSRHQPELSNLTF